VSGSALANRKMAADLFCGLAAILISSIEVPI
jgi:hypothetical protein